MSNNEYNGCKIINIRKHALTGTIHASLVNKDGTLLIAATLEYINKALAERLP